MHKLILLPCVVMLTAAAPAASAPPIAKDIAPSDSQTIVSGGKVAQTVEEKKIFKNLPTTGSRLSKRACLTDKEWKQVEEDLEHTD